MVKNRTKSGGFGGYPHPTPSCEFFFWRILGAPPHFMEKIRQIVFEGSPYDSRWKKFVLEYLIEAKEMKHIKQQYNMFSSIKWNITLTWVKE